MFVIQNLKTNKFLGRQYSSEYKHWVDDLDDARTYPKRGHANVSLSWFKIKKTTEVKQVVLVLIDSIV